TSLKEFGWTLTKITEGDKRGQTTPLQKCNYSEDDCGFKLSYQMVIY
ncbi:37241_t:CDS:1, partial [Gigaspora margarita]